MKHTEEPWKYREDKSYDGFFSESTGGNGPFLWGRDSGSLEGENKEDDVARIVSCVNSCKDINPEIIPELVAAIDEFLHTDSLDGGESFHQKLDSIFKRLKEEK